MMSSVRRSHRCRKVTAKAADFYESVRSRRKKTTEEEEGGKEEKPSVKGRRLALKNLIKETSTMHVKLALCRSDSKIC